jgi:hypothetical protein
MVAIEMNIDNRSSMSRTLMTKMSRKDDNTATFRDNVLTCCRPNNINHPTSQMSAKVPQLMCAPEGGRQIT